MSKTNKTYLVTGGAGFIGSHIAQKLTERGDKVVIVDNFNDYYNPQLKEDRLSRLLKNADFKLYREDIADYEAIEKIFTENKIDAINHQAAQAGVRYSLENPHIYEKSNVQGTLNLLEMAQKHGVKNFVFASSSSVYGGNTKIPFSEEDKTDNPISLYGATKASTELLARTYHHLYGLDVTGLRYFTVYGPWTRPDMALFKFTDRIFNEKPIEVYGEGEMARDFTYIDDITAGALKAQDTNKGFRIINLGLGEPVGLEKFIETIEKHAGKKAQKEYKPMQPGDVRKTWADTKKAQNMLNWTPKTIIDEGVKNFVEWYGSYYGNK